MEGLKEQVRQILFTKSRIIGKVEGSKPGPAIVFCGGIHGNEPAGVMALIRVFNTIKEKNIVVSGKVLGFIGNRNALHKDKRFIDNDLNRLWTLDNIHKLHNGGFSNEEMTAEKTEMVEIDELLMSFIKGTEAKHRYFVDLHTTSSTTIPFAAIDRMKQSIEFAMQLPIPFIINLDEFLKGTLLHYLDHINFGAMVFEAGKHEDPVSVNIHEALIWLVLHISGAIAKEDVPNYEGYLTLLGGINEHPHQIFNIIHREPTNNGSFKMAHTFVNFQPIKKGQLLAYKDQYEIACQHDGFLFMPLYQNQGADGYFIVRKADETLQEL
ncbi:MAG: succinylglutamate desuccinylase/aspartoacylase family protein [Cyclobacteriaceae bacterium]|nr:succinylglutamate desuccinylase/aspartoacylase family protein [Cyclobacteriaceae bacterium]